MGALPGRIAGEVRVGGTGALPGRIEPVVVDLLREAAGGKASRVGGTGALPGRIAPKVAARRRHAAGENAFGNTCARLAELPRERRVEGTPKAAESIEESPRLVAHNCEFALPADAVLVSSKHVTSTLSLPPAARGKLVARKRCGRHLPEFREAKLRTGPLHGRLRWAARLDTISSTALASASPSSRAGHLGGGSFGGKGVEIDGLGSSDGSDGLDGRCGDGLLTPVAAQSSQNGGF